MIASEYDKMISLCVQIKKIIEDKRVFEKYAKNDNSVKNLLKDEIKKHKQKFKDLSKDIIDHFEMDEIVDDRIKPAISGARLTGPVIPGGQK
jgi:hypothetical protein